MKLQTHAEITVPRPPAVVFDFAVACETFPRVLVPLGLVPGVAKAEMIDGTVLRAGARRHVTLTDGNVVDEEILACDRPLRHTYRWIKPPAGPLGLLVRSGTGDWTFTPAANGTQIVWTYTFELTTPLAYPLAAVVIRAFRRWMRRGLANVRDAMARQEE